VSRKVVIALLILLIFSAISIAFSQPKPLPTPGYVTQQQQYLPAQTYTLGQPYQSAQIKDLPQSPTEQTTYEKRSETAYFLTGTSSPIEIDKWTYPETKNGHPVNNPIYVYVDIKSKTAYPIENIQVKEETNQALIINNTWGYCKIDPIRECFNEINISRTSGRKLMGKINNNSIIINITRLDPKEWIRYNYTLLPQMEGIYYADTLVRIGSNTSDFKDLFLPLKINIEPMINEFNVIPQADKYQAYTEENITIVYTIRYLGNNPSKCKFNAMLDPNRRDFDCVNNKSAELIFDNIIKTQNFSSTMHFNQIGPQPIPGITISDSHFSSNPILIPLAGSLNIDTMYLRYKVIWDYFIQFVSILVSILIGIYGFQKEFGGSIEELKSSIKALDRQKEINDKTIPDEQIPLWWNP
jgi:hypothetical protein